MNLRFAKMSGAGNDFVLVRAGDLKGRSPAVLAKRLCDRRRGIGADGLLVVEPRSGALGLAYFNADGSRAFCGNGSRCAVWYGHESGLVRGRRTRLDADGTRLEAEVTGREQVRLRMPEPKDVRLGLPVPTGGRHLTVHHIDTGVPHAVVFVPGLESVPVETLGRELRRHRLFRPAGANVDFVATAGRGLSLRTYERGVEAETLACGTGVVASALVAALLGKVKSPVRCLTRGGDTLTVQFRYSASESRFSDVWLEGPAKIVFEGEIDV